MAKKKKAPYNPDAPVKVVHGEDYYPPTLTRHAGC